ncbi:hypothetical protein [Paenibacillus illinoisensis]|uniref:Uncharacterized protein n=1 Tax=Paenibacillus illinoisensis TaxID=59845 RepID=A0A2W0C291_9BACL|nr:hypothetical protein [Paenibacillus illinoisensis]PYY25937.1 hypothetical protein PIL02S_05307 [Paenibacillus illinoisensis]
MCQNSFNDAPVMVLVQSMQQLMEQVHVNAGHCLGFMPDHNDELAAAFQKTEQEAGLLKKRLENILQQMNDRSAQTSTSSPIVTFFD